MAALSLHNYDLLGFNYARQTFMFSGSDSLELFQKNLKTNSDDWYYKTRSFTYSFNEQGHRCKEVEEIDFNNYILFVGDSNTEGVGLELETTHPYLTAQKLNMSYYNLGMGGTGLDVMFYNLTTWLCKFPKPKFVVVSLTNPMRFLGNYDYKKNNRETFRAFGAYMKDKNIYNYLDKNTDEFINLGDRLGYFDTRALLTSNMMKNLLTFYSIPYEIISFSYFDIPCMKYKEFNYYGNTHDNLARDQMHPGIDVNKVVTDYLVSQYTDKYLNARDNHDIRGQKQS